jgi:hypothetical protein
LYVYSRADQKPLFTWKPKEKWKGTYANVAIYKDLWILTEANGTVRALKPLE